MQTALIVLGALLLLYLAIVLALIMVGRREHARALAGFAPDCAVLLSRLAKDPCVPRRRGLFVGLLVAYLASPIDLIPDFIPVVGLLDDAILIAVVLRLVTRDCSRARMEDLWPGPASSLEIVLKLARAQES
jgi:uncharacterized membrane protein YkvA (DUF1232 family)